MVLGLPRMVVLQSKSPATLTILGCPNFAPEGSHERPIRLEPDDCIEIPANKFDCGRRGSTIKIFVDGVELWNPLIPETFLHYVKILFYVDDYGLVVKGVKPKLTDLCRIRGFGFLGREFTGRPEETIKLYVLGGL